MCILPHPKVTVIRCQPKTHRCPTCGKRGRRVRRLDRKIRTLAYKQEAWLHVFYAEYKSRCGCCKYFRSWPVGVPQKSDYDDKVRLAVLDRLLLDGLNVEGTRTAMERDFLLELSSGFVYDCLDWGLTHLNSGDYRRQSVWHFSGILCIDELHLGDVTLLLATDPIADRVVGFLPVPANDQPHMRRFLLSLNHAGFEPHVVITDGSNLYPAVLAEIWPQALHQLCLFHVMQDINDKVLDALRRLRNAQKRRGNGGRKRKKGRPSKRAQQQRQKRGPTNKEKAAFVFKHRFLVVKREENLTEREKKWLAQMLEYLPELRVLRQFCKDIHRLFSPEQTAKLARARRTHLLKRQEYQEVPELAKAMEALTEEKFDKMIEFLNSPPGQQIRTNNHVERMNRKVRLDEKKRYGWRTSRSLNRFLRLRLAWVEAAEAADDERRARSAA